MSNEIRAVRPEDIPALADGLARAFADNLTYGFLFNDETSRHDDLDHHLSEQLTAAIPAGTAGAAVGAVDSLAAAVWVRQPASPPLGMWPQGHRTPGVAERSLELVTSRPPGRPDGPSLLLMFVGVAPENQHRGVGIRLLERVAAEADHLRVTVATETPTVRARDWLVANGYEVTGTSAPAGDLPERWTLVRPASVKERSWFGFRG